MNKFEAVIGQIKYNRKICGYCAKVNSLGCGGMPKLIVVSDKVVCSSFVKNDKFIDLVHELGWIEWLNEINTNQYS